MSSLLNKVKNYISDNILCLSGEIIVGNNDTSKILELNDDVNDTINRIVRELQIKYNYLDISLKNGLCESTIKFFCYDKHVAEDNFLNAFEEDLGESLTTLLENDSIMARLNIFGTYIVGNNMVEYRFLNKNETVKHKVISSTPVSAVRKLYGRKVQVGAVMLIVSYFIGVVCYNYYLLKFPQE